MGEKTLHPLYVLKPISGGLVSEVKLHFEPQMNNDYDAIAEEMKKLEKTKIDKLINNASNSYSVSIENLDEERSYKYLSIIFPYKQTLMKSLIETAISVIGIGSRSTVNSVFAVTSETMSSLDAVLVTKMLLESVSAGEISDKYAEYLGSPTLPNKVKQIKNGEIELDTILKDYKEVITKHYSKLSVCDPYYWAYPAFLASKKKPKELLEKPLPEPLGVDQRRSREILKQSAVH